ncbi:hypothetical protein [Paraherbaspirillum soli]|uniref:Apea-like HEPN domain-containing protein n=1 Tax=Paraherbaspirillum soli TaxID=631222 RepID=A0ABW0MD54_9BURK
MSTNITRFMQEDIYDWFFKNISEDVKPSFLARKDFWVVPVSTSDPEYANIVDHLKARFTATKIESCREIEGLGIAVVREGDKTLVCGAYKDGQSKLVVSDVAIGGINPYSLSFLQKMAFVSKLDARTSNPIDSQVWKNDPIFESDVETYLPEIICFEVETESSNSSDVLILKFLLSLELGSKNVKAFRDDLIAVMLSIPNAEHDWLAQQLLYAVLSRRDSNFYAELYKLVEFFFPLFKISKLKKSINFSGSHLKLLDICMTDLGWHVNHQLGSRLALNYASVEFAEVMLKKAFVISEDEEKRFKEDAMEKITELRHSLIHQIFKQNDPAEADITRATRSLLVFLSSSFEKYNAELANH